MLIKRWDSDFIIVNDNSETVRECLEKNRIINFYRADLRNVDISGANLHDMGFQGSKFNNSITCSSRMFSSNGISDIRPSSSNFDSNFSTLELKSIIIFDISWSNVVI